MKLAILIAVLMLALVALLSPSVEAKKKWDSGEKWGGRGKWDRGGKGKWGGSKGKWGW